MNNISIMPHGFNKKNKEYKKANLEILEDYKHKILAKN